MTISDWRDLPVSERLEERLDAVPADLVFAAAFRMILRDFPPANFTGDVDVSDRSLFPALRCLLTLGVHLNFPSSDPTLSMSKSIDFMAVGNAHTRLHDTPTLLAQMVLERNPSISSHILEHSIVGCASAYSQQRFLAAAHPNEVENPRSYDVAAQACIQAFYDDLGVSLAEIWNTNLGTYEEAIGLQPL